jgi:hypothetical protein
LRPYGHEQGERSYVGHESDAKCGSGPKKGKGLDNCCVGQQKVPPAEKKEFN